MPNIAPKTVHVWPISLSRLQLLPLRKRADTCLELSAKSVESFSTTLLYSVSSCSGICADLPALAVSCSHFVFHRLLAISNRNFASRVNLFHTSGVIFSGLGGRVYFITDDTPVENVYDFIEFFLKSRKCHLSSWYVVAYIRLTLDA